MNNKRSGFVIWALILGLVALAGCAELTATPSSAEANLLLPMSDQTNAACVGCTQAAVDAVQTQQQMNSAQLAASTAQIMRANAQATLVSANATLNALQTQYQNEANIAAMQLAATAEFIRANADATLVASGATQNAALTQDAIRQTQVQESLNVSANGTQTQQGYNLLAGGTQTQVANVIATQTQAAQATAQWYKDQARQREEQRQVPLNFLWLWCPPLFIIAIAAVSVLFFWRWMRIKETAQLIAMRPTEPIIIEHQPRASLGGGQPQAQIVKQADHVRRWMDEVKRKLRSDKKDEDDKPGV